MKYFCIIALKPLNICSLSEIWINDETAIKHVIKCSAAKNIVPETLQWKLFFEIKMIWFNDYFMQIHIKMVMQVSLNYTIMNLFKMHDDVHLCSYALCVIEN